MNQTYKIDFAGASPFQVYDGAGNTMFDARYSTMRVEQFGSVGLNQNFHRPTTDGTDAFANIFLSRTRGSQAPLYNIVAYSGGSYGNTAYRYTAPFLTILTSNLYGIHAISTYDRLVIGNQSFAGGATVYYAIYGNSAG